MYYLADDALVSGHEAAPKSDDKDAERRENKGKDLIKKASWVTGEAKQSHSARHLSETFPTGGALLLCSQCSGNISVVAITEGVPGSRRP